MNLIILTGRLTKEPDVRVTPKEKKVCNFTLAVDRDFKDADGNKQTDFINIQTWSKLAELCETYLGKGQKVLVQGSLQIHSYVNKENQTRWITNVIASKVEFLERKSGGDSSSAMEQFQDDEEEVPF